MTTADSFPPVPCDVCGADVPYIALTPSFHDPSVVGHRECVAGDLCGVCKRPIGDGCSWSQFVGKSWRGHKNCAQSEAAKYVLVLRADIESVLDSVGSQEYGLGEAGDRLADALEVKP
jgi:hypothetical protein